MRRSPGAAQQFGAGGTLGGSRAPAKGRQHHRKRGLEERLSEDPSGKETRSILFADLCVVWDRAFGMG